MNWEILLVALFYVVTTMAAILAWAGYRRRPAPGSYPFSWLMLVVAIWFFASGMGTQSNTTEEKVLWTKVTLVTSSWIGPLWIATVLSFLHDPNGVTRRWMVFTWLLPVLSTGLILTNDYHHLVWAGYSSEPMESFLFFDPLLRFSWGVWFWVYVIYSHLFNFTGFIVLLLSHYQLPAFQRKQARGLLVGWGIPWTTNFVYVAGAGAYPSLDPTPVAFVATFLIFIWDFLRLQLFDPGRLARRAVISNIEDGYIVVDTRNRLVDANEQALRLLGLEQLVVGMPAARFLRHRPDVLQLMRMNFFSQVDLPAGGERILFLEATLWPWYENGKNINGRILILHDVTQRKTLELRLQTHLTQQTFANDLQQLLYRSDDQAATIRTVLEQIGRFAHADRVVICRDRPGYRSTFVEASWTEIQPDLPLSQVPLLEYDSIPSWKLEMEAAGVVVATMSPALSEDLATFLRQRGALSIAAFPLFDHQGLWGCLLLENLITLRTWSSEDLDLLKNAARLLSGAIARWSVEDAERRQRDLAEALRDMASVLNSTLNLQEVLDRAQGNLARVVPHDASSFALLVNERSVRFERWKGYNDIAISGIPRGPVPVKIFQTFQIMLETHRPVILSDVRKEPSWEKLAGYEWVQSYLGVPIENKGRVVGFISLDSRYPGFFTSDHVERLQAFADDVGVAIENARLYDEAHQRAEEMAILYRIGLTLTSGLEMDEVLAALLKECLRVLPVDVFYVALYDPDTGILHHPIFWEQGVYTEIPPRSIHSMPGMSEEIIRTQQMIYLQDTMAPQVQEQYPSLRAGGVPSRSYVGVPLRIREQVVGVISMQSYEPNAYTESQLRLLETIATQAAVAVENARIFEQMRQMAITDPVTQLFTRRHFTTLARAEVQRSLRYNRSLCLLMIDIDRFKRINDTWGHNTGDQVLQAVAQMSRQSLRQSDLLGRWGGEEFAAVLPESSERESRTIAERIRYTIEKMEIPVANETVQVTVSIGLTVIHEQCNTLEEMVNCADQALYQAKQSGRNRVVIWGGIG